MRLLPGRCCLPFVLLFLFLTPSRADAGEAFEGLRARTVSFRLDNGLRVILCPRGGVPVVSCVTCIAEDAVEEDPQTGALAQLLARLAFKGTPSAGGGAGAPARPPTDEGARGSSPASLADADSYLEVLDRAGAVGLSATAGPDRSVAVVSLPAHQLELWAALEADRLMAFRPRGFEPERLALLEAQHAQYEEQPFGRLYANFLAAAFGERGYGRRQLGRREDLLNCTPAQAAEAHRAQVVPDRIVLALSGGFETAQVRPLLEAYFGRLQRFGHAHSGPVGAPARTLDAAAPGGAGTLARPPTGEGARGSPPQDRECRVEVEFPAEPIFLAGYPIPARAHADTPALEVLAELIGNGRASRLRGRLVSGGLARAASVWLGPGARRPRLFIISAEPAEGVATERVEAAVDEELRLLRSEAVTAAELQRAVAACRGRHLRELRTNLGLALELAEHEALDGDWRGLFTAWEAFAGVSAEQTQAVAARYLVASRRTTARLVPPAQAGVGSILGVPVAPPGGTP